MEQEKTITLPPKLIAALYGNVLIDSSVEQHSYQVHHAVEKKKALIIAKAPESALPADQKKFLDAIIKACKIEHSDIELITDKHSLFSDYKKMNEQFCPENVILFGMPPSSIELPMLFPEFQIHSFEETKYLHTPALDAIENDKGLKLELWQCLKQLFP